MSDLPVPAQGDNRLPVLAAEIMRAHAEARQAAQMSVEKAIQCGDALLEAKEQLGHGKWLPWLESNCPGISERTAQRYMRLAKHKDEVEAKKRHVSDLSLRGAIEALVPPDPRKEAAERINELWQQFEASRDTWVQTLAKARAGFDDDAAFMQWLVGGNAKLPNRLLHLLDHGDGDAWTDALLHALLAAAEVQP